MVIVVVIVAVMAWWVFNSLLAPVNNATIVTITSVSLTIDYPGAVQYFGASPITSCSACPIHGTITNPAKYTFSLTNSDSATHNVTGVTPTGFQFALLGTSPSISAASPLTIAAGATRSITLSITGTSLAGDNVLTGTISTN